MQCWLAGEYIESMKDIEMYGSYTERALANEFPPVHETGGGR
jgi:hypothetical protein